MSREVERRLRMGLETLTGDRAQGFFSPYRYAHTVVPPKPYVELEDVFREAQTSIESILACIDANGAALALLDGPPPTPRWDQSWFPRLDGAAAWAVVQTFRPRQIVEVGSGHSTRMLAYAAQGAEVTCIDPEPRAPLPPDVRHLPRVLSTEDIDAFRQLQPGDIAFFDSSHLMWPGSDVDIIVNRIIPALAPGVLIHIHDILLPDPYPDKWEWRGYTEQNAVAPLLLGGCRIVFSSHYALSRMGAAARPGIAAIPLAEGALETSLWLQRS